MDAFTTLLHPSENRYLIPRESFLVQLKSNTASTVDYRTPDAVKWLNRLEIPLFIARVDLSRASITLHPTHRLSQVLLEGHHKKIRLHLEPFRENSPPEDVRHVALGQPALTWSTKDLVSREFASKAYDVLSAHVGAQQRNTQCRGLGYCEPVAWEPGEVPKYTGAHMMMAHSGNENRQIPQALVQPLRAYIFDLNRTKRYEDLPIVLAFVEMLRKRGVDPDPGNYMRLAAFMTADGDAISESDIVRYRSAVRPGEVDLSRTVVGDAALAYLPNNTEMLSLAHTKITDEGLKCLTRLKLQRLNIAHTKVTDSGLAELKNLSTLVWMNVTGTEVSSNVLEEFKAALPSVTIVNENP